MVQPTGQVNPEEPEAGGRRTSELEVALLSPREGYYADCHSSQLIKLLLVCNRAEERSIVAFFLYHDFPWREVADRVGVTEARAKDVYRSLERRVELAEERAARLALIEEHAPAKYKKGRRSRV